MEWLDNPVSRGGAVLEHISPAAAIFPSRSAEPVDTVVAQTRFTDRQWRPVYETPDQRQYVIDADGLRVWGEWFIPPDPADEPAVVIMPGSGS